MFDFVDNGMILAKIKVNGTDAFTSSNIRGFSYNRYSTSAIAPEFGNVSAGQLTFTVDTDTTDNVVERGDIINATIYLESDPTVKVETATLIVTDAIKSGSFLDVTCLDEMISLDVEADLTGIAYQITATDFINQVFGTNLGMSVTIDENIYLYAILDDPSFEEGTTYRQVLSKVCECMGAGAWCDSDGLHIGFYSDIQAEIDDSLYVGADLSSEGFTIKVEVTDDVTAIPVEINGTEITLRIVANPFLANKTTTQRSEIASAIKRNIGNVTWYGGGLTTLPMPELNPYSVVTVDNKSYPITSVTYGINENTKLESKITSDDNSYNYAVEKELAKIKQSVESLENGNKHFFYRDDSGVHITMVENNYNTGRNIHIDSDSLDVRDGTKVLASFGEETRIGEEDKSHIDIKSNLMRFTDNNGFEKVVFKYNGATEERVMVEEPTETGASYITLDRLVPISNDLDVIYLPNRQGSTTSYDTQLTLWGGSVRVIRGKLNLPKERVVGDKFILFREPGGLNVYLIYDGVAENNQEQFTAHITEGTSQIRYPIYVSYQTLREIDRTWHFLIPYNLFFSVDNVVLTFSDDDPITLTQEEPTGSNTKYNALLGFADGFGTGFHIYNNTSNPYHEVDITAEYSLMGEAYNYSFGVSLENAGNNSLVIGQFNDNNSGNAFEIGNGTDGNRSNAFTVDWDGNVNIAIDITAQGGTTDGDLYTAIETLMWEGDVIA